MKLPQEARAKMATMLREMAERMDAGEIQAAAYSGHNGIIEVSPSGLSREYEATGIQAHVIVTGKAESDQACVTSMFNAIDERAADVMKPLALG